LDNSEQRLQKYLAACGLGSRREIEKWISEGRVSINGRPAVLGSKVRPLTDKIYIDGKLLQRQSIKKYYYALHKPKGVVTTMRDERGRHCIADIVKDLPERVYPVGRLDRNTEGLLILTNDGEFANRLMHPRHHLSKVYHAFIEGDVTAENLRAFASGMVIDGYKTMPVEAKILDRFENGTTLVKFVLKEGRNRQIRKMCEQQGLVIKRLIRVSIGGVELGNLKKGEIRELTPKEVAHLMKETQV